jgi:hypothetical protein
MAIWLGASRPRGAEIPGDDPHATAICWRICRTYFATAFNRRAPIVSPATEAAAGRADRTVALAQLLPATGRRAVQGVAAPSGAGDSDLVMGTGIVFLDAMKPVPITKPNLTSVRRAVVTVASLNLGYFGIEFAVARAIGSVSLFADSIDFLEDATVNGLILIALGWSARRRSIVGMILAIVLFAPGVATLWAAWEKFNAPSPPAALPLTLTGLGALAVNLVCAFSLARVRAHRGSLTRAAFLSARNDALANVAIIAAGLVTAIAPSPWPDLVVGIGIFAMNLDASRQVYSAAQDERRLAIADP